MSKTLIHALSAVALHCAVTLGVSSARTGPASLGRDGRVQGAGASQSWDVVRTVASPLVRLTAGQRADIAWLTSHLPEPPVAATMPDAPPLAVPEWQATAVRHTFAVGKAGRLPAAMRRAGCKAAVAPGDMVTYDWKYWPNGVVTGSALVETSPPSRDNSCILRSWTWSRAERPDARAARVRPSRRLVRRARR